MAKPRLVAKPIGSARARHRLATSKPSAALMRIGRFLIPIYLHFILQFRDISIQNPEELVNAMADFQEGRTRLIIAFRHPYGDEPQLLYHVFENLLPRTARRMGKQLTRKLHVRLVHDYAVALWGDAMIRFLLPRVGALPVYHVKFDAESLNNIRSVMRDGPSPLGLAPEGQISYHSETLPRIEQGTVRMGFWCARDLDKAARQENVLILPLSVHYHFDSRDQKKLYKAMNWLESCCGLKQGGSSNASADLLSRVDALENRLLLMTENYYTSTYGYQLPEAVQPDSCEPGERQRRWTALLPFALSVAESMLGIDPKDDDDVLRMYRVRLEGWERIYPEAQAYHLTPVAAALADRRAGEAWYAMRHMELVDLMSYHDADYLTADTPEKQFFDRLVETVTTLEDLTHRLMGGNITNRPNRIRKKAILVPGRCLNLTEHLPDYRINARQTTVMMTEELARRFQECIKEYRHEQ
jgi:hypothetical protein